MTHPLRSRPARGVALVVVMAALALIALVAARFAQRIDDLRAQTASLRDLAEQRLQIGNAMAAALYAVSTGEVGPAGFGDRLAPAIRADDRPYTLPMGGRLQVQDERGLFALNAPDRTSLAALLAPAGVDARMADQLLDVLQDYVDTDQLKRLNGAERREYEALGLPPPRDDWLISVRELNRMPLWRDLPAAVSVMERLGSTSRSAMLNANTASAEVLAAVLPGARPEQIELLKTLRAHLPFTTTEDVQRATGLVLRGDAQTPHVGPALRLTASASLGRRALQYNIVLLPAGRDAPWLISNAQPVSRGNPKDTLDRADPFPLAVPAALKP